MQHVRIQAIVLNIFFVTSLVANTENLVQSTQLGTNNAPLTLLEQQGAAQSKIISQFDPNVCKIDLPVIVGTSTNIAAPDFKSSLADAVDVYDAVKRRNTLKQISENISLLKSKVEEEHSILKALYDEEKNPFPLSNNKKFSELFENAIKKAAAEKDSDLVLAIIAYQTEIRAKQDEDNNRKQAQAASEQAKKELEKKRQDALHASLTYRVQQAQTVIGGTALGGIGIGAALCYWATHRKS